VSRPRHLTTFGSLASALVAVGALALPAGAAAQTRTVETATAGDVTAELSYVKRRRGSGEFRFVEFRDFRVRVLRAGQVLYDKPIGNPCHQFCTPTESALTRKHVGLRDLNGDGEPEAIVDLFTGGSSCCVFVYAYGFDAAANVYRRARLDTGGSSCCVFVYAYGFDAAANVYRRARLDTGGGFVVRDHGGDGLLELVGDDFRFRGLFTCGACGSRPVRIWHYALTRFEVVTPLFPAQIRTHARRMKRIYERVRHRKDAPVFVKGALTPYAADLCLLDRCGAGFRLVRLAIRRGELDRRSDFDVSPHGAAYLSALKRFLRRSGYLN